MRLRLEELEDRCVPAVMNTNACVNAMYLAILHRPADPTGLAFWGGLINSGQETPQQVALGIQTSVEGENVLINSLYQQILGRQADPGGLAFWRGVFEANNNNTQGGQGDSNFDDPDDFNFDGVTAVRLGLFCSQEFHNKSGGTVTGFMTQVYLIGLGRQPDPGGLAQFSAELNPNDPISCYQVLFEVLTSQEALTNEVRNFYQTILGRQGEAAGVNFWVAGLQGGTSQGGTNTVSTIAGFVGSDEFCNNATNNPNFNPNATPSTGAVPGGAGGVPGTPASNIPIAAECVGFWEDDLSDALPGTPHRTHIRVNSNDTGTVQLDQASGVLVGTGTYSQIAPFNTSQITGPVHSFFAIVTANSGTTFTGPNGTHLSQVLMQFDCGAGGTEATATFTDTNGNPIDNTIERINLVKTGP
jgi:hypothetical protein